MRGGGLGGFGPVVVGPRYGLIAAGGRRAKQEDIVLGDANMFEQLPRGVWQTFWNGSTMLFGKVLHGIVKGCMGLSTIKQRHQLFAKLIGSTLCCLRHPLTSVG